jgi:hypothetical protein
VVDERDSLYLYDFPCLYSCSAIAVAASIRNVVRRKQTHLSPCCRAVTALDREVTATFAFTGSLVVTLLVSLCSSAG